MVDGGNGTVAILLGAIASMAGFIVWLFRFVVNTQNTRIERLEGEQAAVINANTKAIDANTETMKEILSIVRALGDILIEQGPRPQFRSARTVHPRAGPTGGAGGSD